MISNSLIARLLLWAEIKPEQSAFTFVENASAEVKHVTYIELLNRSISVSDYLYDKGFNGKNCLLVFNDRETFIYAFVGCLLAGAIPVPIKRVHANKNNHFIESVINDVRPSCVLYSGHQNVNGVLDHGLDQPTQWVDWTHIQSHSKRDSVSLSSFIAPEPNDVAYLQYTSGSIADPKGTIITHQNIASNQQMIKDAFNHSESTIMVSWLPHYHDMGLVGTILHPLYMGFVCIHFPTQHFVKFPLDWLRIISRFNATCSGGPNFAYELCLSKAIHEDLSGIDLCTWKTAFNGSEPVKAQTIKKFSHVFRQCGFNSSSHFPVYGMAEATLFISGARNRFLKVYQKSLQAEEVVPSGDETDLATVELVACGMSQDTNHFTIQDKENGNYLQPYHIGQVVIRGEFVSPGYWSALSSQSKQFDMNVFVTGDLGFVDADGYLYITGRETDLYIINGRNIYAHDVELRAENLAKSLFGSNCCYSFVVDGPSQKLILAFESRRNLDAKIFYPLASQIMEDCYFNFGVSPSQILLIKKQAIFRTSSGKKKRVVIKSLFLDDQLKILNEYSYLINKVHCDEINRINQGNIADYFFELVVKKTNLSINMLNGESSLFQYGFDSLALLELNCDLEKRFKINIPMEIFYAGGSIKAIASSILAYYNNPELIRSENTIKKEYELRLTKLDDHINSLKPLTYTIEKPQKFLLTGATGFLGVHLLVELLTHQGVEVFCLIRARNLQYANDRLVKHLSYYGFTDLSRQLSEGKLDRVRILCGDVAKAKFGLVNQTYQSLSRSIDAVIHSAAIDNFFLPYQALCQTNVVGTEHIIKFSLLEKNKYIHHISSCAASLVNAENLDSPDQGLLNGYAKTKYIAENLILKALKSGLLGGCYRLGYIYSSTLNLIDETDAFESIVSVLPQMGYFPIMNTLLDLTPVEYASRCIIDDVFLRSNDLVLKSYYNPVRPQWRDVCDSLFRQGVRLKQVALPEFVEHFREFVRHRTDLSLKSLSPIISVQLENQLDQMFVNVSPALNSKVQFNCPPCDADFLDRLTHEILVYANKK